MVAEYGMSEELGYLSLKDSKNPNNSYGFNKKYSENTAQRIDQAIQDIIAENYKRTLDLLNDHRDKLEKMAETLLEKEVINHNDIRELLGDRPNGNYPEGIFESNGKTEDTIKKSSVSNGNSEVDSNDEESEKKGDDGQMSLIPDESDDEKTSDQSSKKKSDDDSESENQESLSEDSKK
jgi:cell division protease FtsH